MIVMILGWAGVLDQILVAFWTELDTIIPYLLLL
jgi:hypothetical protein